MDIANQSANTREKPGNSSHINWMQFFLAVVLASVRSCRVNSDSLNEAENLIEKARFNRRQWLQGLISDEECRDAFLAFDYATINNAGLSDEFDEVAQVHCAIEWLQKSSVGGDSIDVVRHYAMRSWDLRQTNHALNDPFFVLAFLN